MSECAAGVADASPTPTPTRAIASCAKFRAMPEAAVIRLQKTMPTAVTVRREPRSAMRAMGMLAKV